MSAILAYYLNDMSNNIGKIATAIGGGTPGDGWKIATNGVVPSAELTDKRLLLMTVGTEYTAGKAVAVVELPLNLKPREDGDIYISASVVIDTVDAGKGTICGKMTYDSAGNVSLSISGTVTEGTKLSTIYYTTI